MAAKRAGDETLAYANAHASCESASPGCAGQYLPDIGRVTWWNEPGYGPCVW